MDHVWYEIAAEIERLRPDLVDEWRSLSDKPIAMSGTWLDRNLPIKGGWDFIRIGHTAAILRNYENWRRQ